MRAPSPTKGGYSPFGRAPGSREGRPSPSPRASSSNLRESSSRGDNRLSALAEAPSSPTNPPATSQSDRRASKEAMNGEFTGFKPGSLLNPDVVPPKSSASDNINGNTSGGPPNSPDFQPPPGPPPSHLKNNVIPSPELDSEGFSVPAAANDPISLAQQEAANAVDENDQPQFKLDIKNEPIREEDADAQAALSSVANTLRSSTLATPSRRAGTIRGRRDVRNTIFVPAPTDTPEVKTENVIPLSPEQSFGSARSPALAHLEHSTSDTQSIRSQRSLTGIPMIKHPDLHQPGLNSSIVETVSASLENGEIKSGAVIGEVALAYGHSDSTHLSSFGKKTEPSLHLMHGIATNTT
jgi:F-BAR domain only protein